MGTAKYQTKLIDLGSLEKQGLLKGIITQNIDGLHHAGGSKNVVEFHGTINTLLCIDCGMKYETSKTDITAKIPRCACGGILKPDFVFYGEGINIDTFGKIEVMAAKKPPCNNIRHRRAGNAGLLSFYRKKKRAKI
jgi:NAD-dependent SIR2 family protein deacetylase